MRRIALSVAVLVVRTNDRSGVNYEYHYGTLQWGGGEPGKRILYPGKYNDLCLRCVVLFTKYT